MQNYIKCLPCPVAAVQAIVTARGTAPTRALGLVSLCSWVGAFFWVVYFRAGQSSAHGDRKSNTPSPPLGHASARGGGGGLLIGGVNG